MNQAELLAEMLGAKLGNAVRENAQRITELRLRCGKPACLRCIDGSERRLDSVDADCFRMILNRLMENSLYACEEELKQGFFTAKGGMRVGVCGRLSAEGGAVKNMSSIASVCIRIPREIKGCARPLADSAFAEGLRSVLIVSPPGLGKTTILRDFVRMASESGWNVAVADERREIAACAAGIPQMDVGIRTDVMDGCPKAISVPMLLRACAPDLIAVDELGSAGDATALLEAARCGVRVAATAHASSFAEAMRRREIGLLLKEGVFDFCAVLGPAAGKICEMRSVGEGKAC